MQAFQHRSVQALQSCLIQALRNQTPVSFHPGSSLSLLVGFCSPVPLRPVIIQIHVLGSHPAP